MIRASDLGLSEVAQYINRVRAGRALPRTEDADQLSFDTATTY
jgi:hypothetical protein